MKLGFLASGRLGYLTISALLEEGIRPELLFSDMQSKDVLSLAAKSQIPIYIGKPNKPDAKTFLKTFGDIDLLFSINYLFLLDQGILSIPRLGSVNIHGSLLPKYRGRTPHVWAIINNEKETGVTTHYMDEGCDTGHVLLQEVIPIPEESTGSDILKEFEYWYPRLVAKTIDLFNRDARPIGTKQDESLATYFGKRTPGDGKIDWSWQKERIYNWVRAQAYPYPGAFAFFEEQKIVIDRIEYSATGFTWDMPNGYIISAGKHPEVKTPNGVVRLVGIRDNPLLKQGKLLA